MTYGATFILKFTDGREGPPFMEFDTLEEAERFMKICNRPSSIWEVGYDYFNQVKINRMRVIMEAGG